MPAQQSALASRSLLQGVARAGPRLVAVGQRGHILVSSDGGANWKQASVPVSSDLTAVFFVNDLKGWAVGHDGVILHSDDGGAHAGRCNSTAARPTSVLVEHMQSSVEAHPQDGRQEGSCSRRPSAIKEQGADKPFLDVWFADENNGYAVGAYNLIFRTRDGGKNWEPWFDQTDNPKLLNLYAIRPAGGRPVHRRRRWPGAEARCRGAALQGAADALQRQLLRRGRRQELRARVRLARQRLPQR